MSIENLDAVLDDKADYLAYKKKKTIEKLGERTHLTMEQIAKLVNHDDHGPVVSGITLGELVAVSLPAAVAAAIEKMGLEAPEAPLEAPTSAPVAKAATQKPAAKKSVAKKPVAKKPVAKSASGKKADFGKKKPRLKREQGYKEIKAALKAAGEAVGRKPLEEATGYTGVQVRTFCKELAAKGEIQILGKGGRSTKYALPA